MLWKCDYGVGGDCGELVVDVMMMMMMLMMMMVVVVLLRGVHREIIKAFINSWDRKHKFQPGSNQSVTQSIVRPFPSA